MNNLFRNKLGIATLSGVLAMLVLLVTACGGAKNSKYTTLPESGWRNYETVVLSLDSTEVAGDYSLFLLLRTTASRSVPFREISLEVETIWNQSASEKDTLSCVFVDDNGQDAGTGVSYDSYCMPLGTCHLQRGDSGVVRVRHLMRRSPLTGIRDIGVELVKND